MPAPPAPFRILALDGGGAKGFYTLGVLKQIETLIGGPLSSRFDLIFGTSTGAIIAALLGLGKTVDSIYELYRDHVPSVMGRWWWRPARRSAQLEQVADAVFQKATFEDLLTGLGIVAVRWATETPLIFKQRKEQAHGATASFSPGFGCSISQAVQASCSAYPFFKRKTLTLSVLGDVELIDGGYCANNPTLYAIAEATRAFKVSPGDLRVVSIGVGLYPEPRRVGVPWLVSKSLRLLQKTLDVNTLSMDRLMQVLFGDIATVRISDAFTRPEMATDLMERNLKKLTALYQGGVDSFAKHETTLRQYFDVKKAQ